MRSVIATDLIEWPAYLSVKTAARCGEDTQDVAYVVIEHIAIREPA